MKTLLARTLLFAGASLLPAFAGNQVLLHNLDPADGLPTLLAAGPSGRLYVVSTIASNTLERQISRVVELDLNGTRLASLDLVQLGSPAAAITDAPGSLIVVGQDPIPIMG